MVVITISKAPMSLRGGDLTKWMQEIATGGVYIGGDLNCRVREELWKE